MNQAVAHVGPTEYTQMNGSEQILITNEFRTELASDDYYTVEVVIESIGVVRVKAKNNVQLKFIYPTSCSFTIEPIYKWATKVIIWPFRGSYKGNNIMSHNRFCPLKHNEDGYTLQG